VVRITSPVGSLFASKDNERMLGLPMVDLLKGNPTARL